MTEQTPPMDAQSTPLKEALQALIKEKIESEVEFEKSRQYFRLEKADNYYRGNQFIAPSRSSDGGVEWATIGSRRALNGDESQDAGCYDYNIDIVNSYGQKYVGALGLRAFYNVKSMPEDPQSEVDRKAARQRGLIALWLRDKWETPTRNIEIFFHQWKAGTVYLFVDYLADERLFGTSEEPVFEEQPVEIEPAGYRCQNCGTKSPQPETATALNEQYEWTEQTVCPACQSPLSEINHEEAQTAMVPQQTGTRKYANSGPVLRLCTGYTVTVPPDCKDIKDAGYLRYEYEEDQGSLLAYFGDDLRKLVDENGDIRGGNKSPDQNSGSHARQAATSIGGIYRPTDRSRWTFTRYWLTPRKLEQIKDKEQREAAKAQFPKGVKISMVDGVVVRQEPDVLADHWGAAVPGPGESIVHDPVCWGILGHQDITNDIWNIMVAYLERGLPSHIADPDIFDAQSFNNKSFLPNEIILSKSGAGSRLGEGIKALQAAKFPDQSAFVLEGIDTRTQHRTGLMAPVWGGGEKVATADEARNRLNQALMQLSVPGAYAAAAWVDAFTMAAGLIEKQAPKNFNVATGGASSEMVDIEALRGGKAKYQAEVGIPMSWTERREELNMIISQNPDLAQALGLYAPINATPIREYLLSGISELKIPGDSAWQKTLETIQQLLEQEPIADGQELLPSIQPEEFVLDYAMEAENVRQWLLDDPGRKAKRENEAGYANVVAYGRMCAMLAQPPLPPGPPGDPGEPPPADIPQPGFPPNQAPPAGPNQMQPKEPEIRQ